MALLEHTASQRPQARVRRAKVSGSVGGSFGPRPAVRLAVASGQGLWFGWQSRQAKASGSVGGSLQPIGEGGGTRAASRREAHSIARQGVLLRLAIGSEDFGASVEDDGEQIGVGRHRGRLLHTRERTADRESGKSPLERERQTGRAGKVRTGENRRPRELAEPPRERSAARDGG